MSTTTTTTATAEDILHLFPGEVDTSLATSHRDTGATRDDSDLAGYDEEQIRLMEEVCIVIDEDDNPIGSASKKVCHLMKNINLGLLHRAFSVFLFDPTSHRMLLQQRASEKITFPDMWTNTCCSHPLGVPGETGASLPDAIAGVKRAAQRKLGHELGIKAKQVPVEEFEFLTRLHYLAGNARGGNASGEGKEQGDAKWGEHEIDYVLFIEAEVDLDVNENEVRDVRWVSEEELKEMFAKEGQEGLAFTPWFKLICQSMLFEWWAELRKEGMGKFTGKGETEIRRML